MSKAEFVGIIVRDAISAALWYGLLALFLVALFRHPLLTVGLALTLFCAAGFYVWTVWLFPVQGFHLY